MPLQPWQLDEVDGRHAQARAPFLGCARAAPHSTVPRIRTFYCGTSGRKTSFDFPGPGPLRRSPGNRGVATCIMAKVLREGFSLAEEETISDFYFFRVQELNRGVATCMKGQSPPRGT
jgi:hypothetical protein